MISDQQQRLRALNTKQSFIVQAPAGSGKTELLTQRYLHLLARVKHPEEILAITFTRKAAAEMRQRVFLSAEKLGKSVPLHRLRIQTIDSLCASLVKQMPFLSHFGTELEPTEDAQKLYEETSKRLFEALDENDQWVAALRNLLSHLDNSFYRFQTLLSVMLGKRDQWLPHILAAKNNKQLREELETGLRVVNQEIIEDLENSLPNDLLKELNILISFLQKPNHDLPEIERKKEYWLTAINLLLTEKGVCRKKILPEFNNDNYKTIKPIWKNILEKITVQDEFLSALQNFRYAPSVRYEEKQWNILQDLLDLLPIAVAQLHLIFKETQQVDFIEISQAALTALGTEEEPTDLSLILDYKIQHILVDEFQDTSITQFSLLEKLTRGWQPNDGRTLFLVGDPMQSIYSFRGAEVGLFLRTQHYGINNILLEKITLTENFRSKKPIVDWINQTMMAISPSIENISQGAVIYSSSITQDQSQEESVSFHPVLPEGDNEAKIVLDLVKNKSESTAILVRARSHLISIIQLLKAHNIAYQAIEIDELWSQPVIQDLLSLTKALLHPADHIAWLSLLRAPFCGLSLQDIYIIAHNRKKTIHQQIHHPSIIEKLSISGQERLHCFNSAINQFLWEKHRYNLHDLVKNTWLSLHRTLEIYSSTELEEADMYFGFLDTIEYSGDIKNFQQFENKLKNLYAVSKNGTQNTIQILTIHKSKGLEFDTVILPSLEKTNPANEKSLLMTMERPRKIKSSDTILAPINHHQSMDDSIYQYLRHEETIRQKNENIRLFYVAITRAKKYLHLIGEANFKDNQYYPTNNSFLKFIWPVVKDKFNDSHADKANQADSTAQEKQGSPLYLSRLTQDFFRILDLKQPRFTLTPFHLHETSSCTGEQRELQLSSNELVNPHEAVWKSSSEAAIGILVHRILEIISQDDLSSWTTARIDTLKPQWKILLANLGVSSFEIDISVDQVILAVTNTLKDPTGQWILSHHSSPIPGYSELKLGSPLQHFIIDRCFVDENNILWIIDYKVTTIIDGNLYQTQLSQYKQLLANLFPEYPIRMAVYFPLQSIFQEIQC